MLSSQQFDRTRRLALSLAGIELAERHRELLGRRSRRLGILDSAGLDSLLDALEEGETAAQHTLLGLLTTKSTVLFRHPHQFELAAKHARQVAARRGNARLWSAAAATGEEPYSMAMALMEVFRHEDAQPPSWRLTSPQGRCSWKRNSRRFPYEVLSNSRPRPITNPTLAGPRM